ncbi:hypothetical protein ABT039_22660 [Streptomyces lasiicapitis]|uniref:hypothetical protein n=1 Tax=Streptomyces lasiicapitis TaxID=1923961 RepID=UPI003318B4FE
MARGIGMQPDAVLYRAVIVKSYADGEQHTVYEGPYDDIGSARRRVTFWRNHLAKRNDGSKAVGQIEKCRPVWEAEAAPASAPRRNTPAETGDPATQYGATSATAAVNLLRTLMSERRGMHGRHAADLLAAHGYTDAAERVRGEVRARNGHLSARQALQLLEREGGAR